MPMVRSTYIAEVKQPGSLALLFMATALSLVSIFVLPDWKWPAQWPVIICVLWATFAWLSFSAIGSLGTRLKICEADLQHARSAPNQGVPAVVKAMQMLSEDKELILLLQPNKLFGQSMLVSIYHEDGNGFEIFLGDGTVSSIQGNGRLQIRVNSWEPAYEHIRQQMIKTDDETLKSLIVRPAPTDGRTMTDLQRKLFESFIETAARNQT